MQREFERFFEYLQNHANEFSSQARCRFKTDALIPDLALSNYTNPPPYGRHGLKHSQFAFTFSLR